VEKVTSRLDAGLQRAAIANQNVQLALEQARARVDTVRKESADPGATGGNQSHLATNTAADELSFASGTSSTIWRRTTRRAGWSQSDDLAAVLQDSVVPPIPRLAIIRPCEEFPLTAGRGGE
jgi:hypothetical protein